MKGRKDFETHEIGFEFENIPRTITLSGFNITAIECLTFDLN